MPAYVLSCAPSDFDVATGVCAHPVYLEFPAVVPPLSVGQGAELAGAVVALWATAFALRSVARFIWRG